MQANPSNGNDGGFLCLMQEDDNDIPLTGLVIGFLESYDDFFTFYYLDDSDFGEHQNKGYVADYFSKKWNSAVGTRAQMIELVCLG